MRKPIIINVVSGKGGTGKSLLCALLGRLLAQEGKLILLVDFDVYIRGLTHFFYIFKKERRKITEGITVSDFLELSLLEEKKEPIIAKERFYEVDLIPAVSEIEEQLNYLLIGKNIISKTKELFRQLKDESYDFIIVDNRAGVDEMIIESCKQADISISISESDPIARTTNENLLRHLSSHNVGKVYTVINKVKFIRTTKDYESGIKEIRGDFSVLGKIPFDVDLFESFGSLTFWDTANYTRYAYAVADSWNKLANREDFDTFITMKRFRLKDIWPLKMSPTFLGIFDRLSLTMGIISLIAFFFYERIIEGQVLFKIKDFLLIYSILFILFPIIRRLFSMKEEISVREKNK